MLQILRVYGHLRTVPAVLPAANLRYKSSSAFSPACGCPPTLTALKVFGVNNFTIYREKCEEADPDKCAWKPNSTFETVRAMNAENRFSPARHGNFACNSMAELREWLPEHSVKILDFGSSLVFDEALCDAMLPLKDAWRRALCSSPRKYANESSVECAFGELLLCDELVLGIDKLPWPEPRPFFSLPAFQRCHDLTIRWLPGLRGRADEFVEWLHVPCDRQRRLSFNGPIDCDVELISTMLPKLIEKFSKDAEPRPFELWMDVFTFGEEEQRQMEQDFRHTEVNTLTGEQLKVESYEIPCEEPDEDDEDHVEERSWTLAVRRGKLEDA